MKSKKVEIWVGLFMLVSILAFLFLSLRVADLKSKSLGNDGRWNLYATFDNIGGLKVGSPVKIGGVVVGRVTKIILDQQTLLPTVTMSISNKYAKKIPDTSSLAVRTQGFLGEQFLTFNLGFDNPELGSKMLKDGSTLRNTQSVLVFEDLIGQFLYNNKDHKNIDKLPNIRDINTTSTITTTP